VEKYEKTNHILVEDVSLYASTAEISGQEPVVVTAAVSLVAAATAKQEPIDAAVSLGSATTEQEPLAANVSLGAKKQEPDAVNDATVVSLDADVALDTAAALEDTAVAIEPTHVGLEEATKGLYKIQQSIFLMKMPW
jgi:hypothetical protein